MQNCEGFLCPDIDIYDTSSDRLKRWLRRGFFHRPGMKDLKAPSAKRFAIVLRDELSYSRRNVLCATRVRHRELLGSIFVTLGRPAGWRGTEFKRKFHEIRRKPHRKRKLTPIIFVLENKNIKHKPKPHGKAPEHECIHVRAGLDR